MTHLDDLIARVRKNGSETMDWNRFRNLYFQQGNANDAIEECRNWAKQHHIHISIDYSVEYAGGGGVPKYVTFLPLPSPPRPT
jgi:hypothetical protein